MTEDCIDFLHQLLSRNLYHIARQVFSGLPVPDLRRLRLVCREWRAFIESEIMEGEEYQRREMEHSLASVTPFLLDLDAVEGSGKTLLGEDDWDTDITETSEL